VILKATFMPAPETLSSTAANVILFTVDVVLMEHALIILGAIVGVMHSLGRAQTPTCKAAVWYVIKWVLTSALLTGFVTHLLETYGHIPAHRWPGVVAFAITFLSDRWPAWARTLLERWLLVRTKP
jgi:hypothetical protein